jgi:hypothetical protein
MASWVRFVVVVTGFILATACGTKVIEPEATTPMPRRDINEVLVVHDEQMMAIPGVVGVYVGLLEDDQTSCLKVMVAKITAELEQALPESLEGYPVVLEETGVIRPLGEQ